MVLIKYLSYNCPSRVAIFVKKIDIDCFNNCMNCLFLFKKSLIIIKIEIIDSVIDIKIILYYMYHNM